MAGPSEFRHETFDRCYADSPGSERWRRKLQPPPFDGDGLGSDISSRTKRKTPTLVPLLLHPSLYPCSSTVSSSGRTPSFKMNVKSPSVSTGKELRDPQPIREQRSTVF